MLLGWFPSIGDGPCHENARETYHCTSPNQGCRRGMSQHAEYDTNGESRETEHKRKLHTKRLVGDLPVD